MSSFFFREATDGSTNGGCSENYDRMQKLSGGVSAFHSGDSCSILPASTLLILSWSVFVYTDEFCDDIWNS
jgi:hypothetical protein